MPTCSNWESNSGQISFNALLTCEFALCPSVLEKEIEEQGLNWDTILSAFLELHLSKHLIIPKCKKTAGKLI